MIFIWVIIIAVISFLWALWSLRREKQRSEVELAKDKISKGRVIYYSSDSEPSDE